MDLRLPSVTLGDAIASYEAGPLQPATDGDCERLVGLVTESSWSKGGRWSRGEFLDYCTEALDGYEPSPGNFAISAYDEDGNYLSPGSDDPDEEGDRALVHGLSGNELWSVYRSGSHVPGGNLAHAPA